MLTTAIFEDRFVVDSVDNSKFEKVSRIKAKSTGYDAELIIDICTELYNLEPRNTISLCIRDNPLYENGVKRAEPDVAAIFDSADYIMHGRVFKFEELSSERRTVFASFGGLMMALTCDKQFIGDIEMDMEINLLLKRIDLQAT